jgi:hypothetical protein
MTANRNSADIGAERRSRLQAAINALLRIEGIGIERSRPTNAAAIALLVIAAHEDPGRCFEQQPGRRKEIRAPDRQVSPNGLPAQPTLPAGHAVSR